MRSPVLLAAVLLLTSCVVTKAEEHPGGMSYSRAGEGEPAIVLVHGFASDSRAWPERLLDLGTRTRTIVLDLPGHGQSEPPAEYTLQSYADGVLAVLDHEEVERAVLVGHSNGAAVAYDFYSRFPERTAGLVIIDGALRSVFTPEQGEAIFAPFRGDDWRELMSGMIDTMTGGLPETERERLRTMATEQPHAAVIGDFEAIIAPNAFSGETIEAPVLFLMTASPQWTPEYRKWLAELAPSSEYLEFPDAGHFLQLERPNEVYAAIEEFLARL